MGHPAELLYIICALDWSVTMDKPRPYLSAALLCEKVIQEKDESISLIRLADRVHYHVEGPAGLPAGIRPIIAMHAFLSLKSGPISGEHTIKMVSENPMGNRKEVLNQKINLLGKDHGQNLIVNMNLGVEHDGLYWFDIFFDEELLTRIPLTIIAAPKQVPDSGETDSKV
jgi:hypothetical protein